MSSVLAYSQVIQALIPTEAWDETYFSLLSLKGHLQSLPGWQSMDVWARDTEEGPIDLVVVTNWDHPAQMALWLNKGVTPDSILRAMEPAPTTMTVNVYEEIA